jgi:hypothetical protein
MSMNIVRNISAPISRIGYLRQQTLYAPHVDAFRAKHADGLPGTHISTALGRVACNAYRGKAEEEQDEELEIKRLLREHDKEVWKETRPSYLLGLAVILAWIATFSVLRSG